MGYKHIIDTVENDFSVMVLNRQTTPNRLPGHCSSDHLILAMAVFMAYNDRITSIINGGTE